MMARVRGVTACLGLFERQVARVEIDVDEHRARAHAQDDVGGGAPAHGRGDDFVAGADAGGHERDFQRFGGGGERAHGAAAAELDNSCSKRSTIGPLASQPERSTSTTPSMVASSMLGRVNGRRSFDIDASSSAAHHNATRVARDDAARHGGPQCVVGVQAQRRPAPCARSASAPGIVRDSASQPPPCSMPKASSPP